jgi:hypothetical protein
MQTATDAWHRQFPRPPKPPMIISRCRSAANSTRCRNHLRPTTHGPVCSGNFYQSMSSAPETEMYSRCRSQAQMALQRNPVASTSTQPRQRKTQPDSFIRLSTKPFAAFVTLRSHHRHCSSAGAQRLPSAQTHASQLKPIAHSWPLLRCFCFYGDT